MVSFTKYSPERNQVSADPFSRLPRSEANISAGRFGLHCSGGRRNLLCCRISVTASPELILGINAHARDPRVQGLVPRPIGLPCRNGEPMAAYSSLTIAERRTRRWPRRPTSIPWPTGSAIGGRGWPGRSGRSGRSARSRRPELPWPPAPPAPPASRTTFASASRSSARSWAGSGGSRSTS